MIFTNAFALNSVLTPAFALSFFLIFHFIISGTKKLFDKPPYLILFWLLLTLSFIFMAKGDKCRNHWFMWTFPFFSYYFVFKNELNYLFTLDEIKYKILKVITYATVFACAFCIFEFCCSNFFGIDLSFIPRGTVEDYNPFDGFFRARSFIEESGHFSFYVEIFGPISVYWIIQNIKSPFKKIFHILTIVLGIMATMSAVGLMFLFVYIALFLNFVIFKNKSSLSVKLGILTCVIAIMSLGVYLYPDLFSTIWDLIVMKLDPDNASFSDRSSRFDALEKLSGVALFIGYGPAAFSTLNVDSFVSLYLGILMNTGVLGFILACLFCFKKYRRVQMIYDRECRFALKWSFIFACAHLAFIDIIYVPWFWILISLIDVIYYKERDLI